MKWFWNRCPRLPEVSLLASGALGGDENDGLERHLAVCNQCRAHYAEIKALSARLAAWENTVSTIEPTAAMRTRWKGAVQAVPAASPDPAALPFGVGLMRIVWRELFLPSRFIWYSLASLWVAMLIVHTQLSGHRERAGAAMSQAVIQAWQEQNRVLAELNRPVVAVPAPPLDVPRPRSQRKESWTVI